MHKSNEQLNYGMYERKSTDAEDRQVQSIDDQERENFNMLKSRPEYHNIKVVKVFKESMSAKKPGRPIFNEMMRMIQNGELDGIVCWKINRLARNPVDGGQIQWLLQNGIIKSIITPGKEYRPTDNVIMMAVELGMANQFILDLSKDVTRGLKSKAEKGWRPFKAPIGYMNDKAGVKGEKKVFKDAERFPLVRKMWELLLTGSYTISRILEKANEEWGLRTFRGDKLAPSTGYAIFTNPFYYGEYCYKGEMYQGKHEPMITSEEFDRAQKILGAKGKPRPKNKRLPFNGIVSCGACGGMITCEEKFKTIKSTGETKKYLYHHCTHKKKDKPCHQGAIRYESLVEQIKVQLDTITIPEEMLRESVKVLRENNLVEETNRNVILDNLQKNYKDCIKRIDNLINLYTSPGNMKRELLTDEEFKTLKNQLTQEKTNIEGELRKVETRVDEWVELTERTFHFATYAKHWFETGDYEMKTLILKALGQNFTLTDGILNISLQEPLLVLKNGLENPLLQKARLEPGIFLSPEMKTAPFGSAFSAISG